jgi:hypothetical protein
MESIAGGTLLAFRGAAIPQGCTMRTGARRGRAVARAARRSGTAQP